MFKHHHRAYPLRTVVFLGVVLLGISGCGSAANQQPTLPVPQPSATATGQVIATTSSLSPTAVLLPMQAQPVYQEALLFISRELGVPPTDIRLVSVREVEWNDSSMGCPQPSVAYTQIIVPGYRFEVEAGGKTYQLHTDEHSRIVRCDIP